jgi:hypothetical protein
MDEETEAQRGDVSYTVLDRGCLVSCSTTPKQQGEWCSGVELTMVATSIKKFLEFHPRLIYSLDSLKGWFDLSKKKLPTVYLHHGWYRDHCVAVLREVKNIM